MVRRGLNVYADNNDILAISRAINCGSPRSKATPIGLQERATWFTKVRRLILRVGEEGPVVRTVQLALAKLGYPLRGTGSFAGATLSAAKDFQKAHGLEVDGEIGAETAKAIDQALARLRSTAVSAASAIAGLIGDRILRIGDAGPIVQAVQLGLARLGYPLKGTCNFGPSTVQSVRDFQTRHALEVDGEVGPEMRSEE